MIHWRPTISRRALVGLAPALWIILVIFATVRARADGPHWGVHLARSASGQAVVDAIDPQGMAWGAYLRLDDEVTAVDSQFFVGDVPSPAHELTFSDATGQKSISAPDIPVSLLMLLIAGALVFVALGGLVYRWSADPVLGRLFLLLSGSFATALVAVPAARIGYAWAGYLTPAMALLAAPCLFGLFLAFPRPMRFGRRLVNASLLLAIPLAAVQFAEPALGRGTVALLDDASWLWMMLNLLGAIALLAMRASRRADRRALRPLLLGTALGVGPLVLLVALPKLLEI